MDIEIEIDLQQGLEAAEQKIDLERPAGIYLYYGKLINGSRLFPKSAPNLYGEFTCARFWRCTSSEPLARAIAVNGLPRQLLSPIEPMPLVTFEERVLAIQVMGNG